MTSSRKKSDQHQLHLLTSGDAASDGGAGALSTLSSAFEPARLTQARRLAGLTKRALADELAVSAVAVGQWEADLTAPRPDHLARLAEALSVPVSFFAAGRPYARLDSSSAHFRSLRRTPAAQRARAVAFTEQVWELTYALEQRVRLPVVDLPGFSAGEVTPTPGLSSGIGEEAKEGESAPVTVDPCVAAQALRRHWGLGSGPIPHLVRTMEKSGIIVTLVNFAGTATSTIDAFSTSHLPRPVVVLTPERANDVYRHRFTAAHELGHLVLHADASPGDPLQEKEADTFAAEFLTPRDVITSQLPARMDLHALDRLSTTWGVSVQSLMYRCREVNVISDATYRRAFVKLNQLRALDLFGPQRIGGYPGEIPRLLRAAFEVAEANGLTLQSLASELACTLPRLRLLLAQEDDRPRLKLV